MMRFVRETREFGKRDAPMPTRAVCQAYAKPMDKPTTRVAIDWMILTKLSHDTALINGDTHVPRVIPARPLILWGFSLKLDVRAPVLEFGEGSAQSGGVIRLTVFLSLSKYSTVAVGEKNNQSCRD
jgi:hypothetical protein